MKIVLALSEIEGGGINIASLIVVGDNTNHRELK